VIPQNGRLVEHPHKDAVVADDRDMVCHIGMISNQQLALPHFISRY
jgi:hypothetical protein